MSLKIAFQAYGQNHINGYGGLEQRFAVNWAYFLKEEGHDVHFLKEGAGCDSSFDLYWNAPVCSIPARQCPPIKARKHIHSYFHFDVRSVIEFCPCHERGECYFSSPYIDTFHKMKDFADEMGNFKAVFTPIAYPDKWRPDVSPGFDRTEIMWANKGSLDPQYGPENAPHYPENSVKLLQALIRLNQKADFKITFVLNSLISNARPEYGVPELIGQLKNVDSVDRLPWTQLVKKMSHCKINTHAGGLTSAINECFFVDTVPLANRNFGFFNSLCQDLDIIPDPQNASSDEIFEGLDRLWFDREWYNKVNDSFQELFIHHRTEGLRKSWVDLEEIVYG